MKRIFCGYFILIALTVLGFVPVMRALASSVRSSSVALVDSKTQTSSCQSTPFKTSFSTAYDDVIGGYVVSAVTVRGLDTTSFTNCARKAFDLAIIATSKATLASVRSTTPDAGDHFEIDLRSEHVLAANVAAIDFLVTSPATP